MARGVRYEEYLHAVEDVMTGLDGGRTGGSCTSRRPPLAPRYPEWDRFQAVDASLDPDGCFSNAYLDRGRAWTFPARVSRRHLCYDDETVVLDLRPHWWYFSRHIVTGVPLLAVGHRHRRDPDVGRGQRPAARPALVVWGALAGAGIPRRG